jgi:hypothetical protein
MKDRLFQKNLIAARTSLKRLRMCHQPELTKPVVQVKEAVNLSARSTVDPQLTTTE